MAQDAMPQGPVAPLPSRSELARNLEQASGLSDFDKAMLAGDLFTKLASFVLAAVRLHRERHQQARQETAKLIPPSPDSEPE